MSRVAVIGGGGNVGRPLLAELQAAKRDGRVGDAVALARSVDLSDPAAVAAQLSGVDALAVVLPQMFSPEEVVAAGHAISAAAADHALSHVVYYTCCGIDPRSRKAPVGQGPYGTAHAACEDLFRERDLPFTSVRSTPLATNILRFHSYEISRHRRLSSPVGGAARINWICCEDVARTIAQVLCDGGDDHDGAVYDLTGPAASLLSYTELAEVISEEIGSNVSFAEVPGSYREFLEFQRFVRAGGFDLTSGTVRSMTGTAPRSVHAFIREHRDVLRDGERMSRVIARADQPAS